MRLICINGRSANKTHFTKQKPKYQKSLLGNDLLPTKLTTVVTQWQLALCILAAQITGSNLFEGAIMENWMNFSFDMTRSEVGIRNC